MYKKNKKVAILTSILFLMTAVSSIFVAGTYAKYISTASATGQVSVAKWAIKVNDTDITGAGTTALGNVTLTETDSEYVVNGKIAPQGSAIGQFVIDPTGTEVAVNYKFSLGTITASSGTVPTGLAVSKVEYCTGTCTSSSTWTAITASGSDYAGSIALTSQTAALAATDKVTVRVTVTWTDNETAGADVADTVDDPNHTAAGVAAPTLSIPVTATVWQKVS